jgi:hypothetical protein
MKKFKKKKKTPLKKIYIYISQMEVVNIKKKFAKFLDFFIFFLIRSSLDSKTNKLWELTRNQEENMKKNRNFKLGEITSGA